MYGKVLRWLREDAISWSDFLFSFFFFFISGIDCYGTRTRRQRWLLRKQNLNLKNQKTNENDKIISKGYQVLDTLPTHG